jgi:hypothetical protein
MRRVPAPNVPADHVGLVAALDVRALAQHLTFVR